MAETKHTPITQEHRDLVHQLVQTLSVVCARGNGHTKNCDWRAQLLADYAAEVERKALERPLKLLARYAANDHAHKGGCDELTEEAESLLAELGGTNG